MEPIPPCVQDPEEDDSWETVYRPEPCEVVAGYHDSLHIHYSAQVRVPLSVVISGYIYVSTYLRIYSQREDGSRFGSLVDNLPPHGPLVLADRGTTVPALDAALPGVYLYI